MNGDRNVGRGHGRARAVGARLAASLRSSYSLTTLPLGTIRGERVNRLIIRGVTVLSGRGTPGTNRAMLPEGPIDIVIENGTIVDMIPMDAVNAAGYGRNFQRATGDKVIDAKGMYVMPGLVEMHAHLPAPNGDLGARALDYVYRIYLGPGVTTVRDAGTGAGMERMAEQRRQLEANQIVGPRVVLWCAGRNRCANGRSATRRRRRA